MGAAKDRGSWGRGVEVGGVDEGDEGRVGEVVEDDILAPDPGRKAAGVWEQAARSSHFPTRLELVKILSGIKCRGLIVSS